MHLWISSRMLEQCRLVHIHFLLHNVLKKSESNSFCKNFKNGWNSEHNRYTYYFMFTNFESQKLHFLLRFAFFDKGFYFRAQSSGKCSSTSPTEMNGSRARASPAEHPFILMGFNQELGPCSFFITLIVKLWPWGKIIFLAPSPFALCSKWCEKLHY